RGGRMEALRTGRTGAGPAKLAPASRTNWLKTSMGEAASAAVAPNRISKSRGRTLRAILALRRIFDTPGAGRLPRERSCAEPQIDRRNVALLRVGGDARHKRRAIRRDHDNGGRQWRSRSPGT